MDQRINRLRRLLEPGARPWEKGGCWGSACHRGQLPIGQLDLCPLCSVRFSDNWQLQRTPEFAPGPRLLMAPLQYLSPRTQ